MAKAADRYFKVDPWNVIEEGFSPEYGLVSESVFSLANEYMGARGYFEEGYSGDRLLGSYFNGVYERRKAETQGYKGIVQETEFMVNSVDWLYLRIQAGDERLDLAKSAFKNFRRELDLKTGLLIRSFVWKTEKGSLQIKLERLISMVENERAAQKLTIASTNYHGPVTIQAGLDFNTTHGGEKLALWKVTDRDADNQSCILRAQTVNTGIEVTSSCRLSGSVTELGKATRVIQEKMAAYSYELTLKAGQEVILEKEVCNLTPLSQLEDAGNEHFSFDRLYEENAAWWKQTWEKSDIEIQGDEENQQGIRFCVFQMYQTYHGAVKGTNIGAKGLTGEAYNGNAFWDTETYCLPFFLFHDQTAAENLLYFRYETLDEAEERAKMLDCKGAFYPIATISGRECCNLWQHASLQLQASTAVAYGIWLYEKITGETAFTSEYGLTILIEICRMLATRGDYNAEHTRYGFYGVMGPDEFQMMVNHNCYTNYMGQFTLRYTLRALKEMQERDPERLKQVVSQSGLSEEECKDWNEKAEAMRIPYDKETKLFEQHVGYFDLPHIDVDAIPIEEFPLYHHWTYDRIYRNDMIKQPDVLMFLFLFNSRFNKDVLKANYEFYEPRCIHESSLSPSVHSILAAQLGKEKEAFDFFGFATRMDLDNYNRNSGEGLHTTSIAAAWMNIVYGFGGLRSDAETLTLRPTIPEKWDSYRFRIVYRGEILCVCVEKEKVSLQTLNGGSMPILFYDQPIEANGEEQWFTIPKNS